MCFFPDKRKRHFGVMLAAVGVEITEGQVDLSQIGPEVIRRLHEAYYGENEFEGLDRLKEALGKIREEFKGVKLSIASGVVVADKASSKWVLYAGGLGKVKVELWRNGSLVSLVNSGEERVLGVSGFLRKEDVVILGTQELFSSIGVDEFEEALKLKSVEAVVDELAPKVHSKDSSLVAGVLLGVSEEVKEKGKAEVEDADQLQTAEKIVVGKKGEPDEPVRTARLVISGVTRKWWEKLRQKNKHIHNQKLYPDISPERKRRKLIGTVMVLLVVLLAVSVGFGFVKQKTSEEQMKFREVQEKVERSMRESQELVELNPLRARALLTESQDTLTTYIDENKSLSKRSEGWVEATTLELKTQLATLLRIYEVTGEVFLDLNLVREGSKASEMDFDGEELLVLDKEAAFFRKEVKGAKDYQAQLSGQLADLTARQQAILTEKSGTFQTSVGDVPLSADPASRPDYNPGFSPAFAAFSFGAPPQIRLQFLEYKLQFSQFLSRSKYCHQSPLTPPLKNLVPLLPSTSPFCSQSPHQFHYICIFLSFLYPKGTNSHQTLPSLQYLPTSRLFPPLLQRSFFQAQAPLFPC